MKLNHKGQSLVAFVIILPVILLILMITIDLGIMGIEKRKVTNILKDTITYSLKHNLDDMKVKEMIDKNIKYENISIDSSDGLSIYIEYKYSNTFDIIKNKTLKIKYKGIKKDDQISLEEGDNG